MPHPTDVEVGRNMRDIRVAKGFSQSTLADKLGISFQQVQKYEKGSNRMGASRLKDVADVLGVSILELFGEDPDAALLSEEAPIRRAVIARARALESIPDPKLKQAILDTIQAAAKAA